MSRVTDAGIVQSMDVVITWDDMAYAFAKATSKGQQVFLLALEKHVTHTKPAASWAFQCHAIAHEVHWTRDAKHRISALLDTLIEHLTRKESVDA